jgi:septum formation inhibitor-activating ATPase MinD
VLLLLLLVRRVGKTTATANIGMSARLGYKVVDADIGLKNLDLLLV